MAETNYSVHHACMRVMNDVYPAYRSAQSTLRESSKFTSQQCDYYNRLLNSSESKFHNACGTGIFESCDAAHKSMITFRELITANCNT